MLSFLRGSMWPNCLPRTGSIPWPATQPLSLELNFRITCLHRKTHLRCCICFSLRLSFHLILQMGWLRFKNVRWLAQDHTVNLGQAATFPRVIDGYLRTKPGWCSEVDEIRFHPPGKTKIHGEHFGWFNKKSKAPWNLFVSFLYYVLIQKQPNLKYLSITGSDNHIFSILQ